MTGIAEVDLVAFAVEVVVLTACAVTLLTSMIAYRQQVLYRSGVRWLATSLALVTVGAIVELRGLLTGSDGLAVVALVVYTASSAAIMLSMWAFARGFIDLGHDDEPDRSPAADKSTDSLSISAPAGDRGFEDAGE